MGCDEALGSDSDLNNVMPRDRKQSTSKEEKMTQTIDTGTWNLDASHSEVGFAVRHAGISKV